MAKHDLSKMDKDQLNSLRTEVENAIRQYDDRRRKEALAAAEAAAAENGFSLQQLLGTRSPAKGNRKTTSPKYRHPENPSITWSGRGRRPAWFADTIAAGISEAHMLITKG